VYKLSKALYGLKHAPWAWYTRLKTFLPEHGYVMRSVDKTLFTLKLGNVRLKTFLLEHGYVIGSVERPSLLLIECTYKLSSLVALLTLLCQVFRK
jgi:hypothetical protein